MKKIRILMADDHPIVALAVKAQIDKHFGHEACITVNNSTGIFTHLNQQPVDALIVDYSMPGGNFGDGLIMLRRIRDKFPDMPIIIFTSINDPNVIAALVASGFHSILSKSAELEQLIKAVNYSLTKRYYSSSSTHSQHYLSSKNENKNLLLLSKKETEVLRMYLAGSSIVEIATTLHRSTKTINNQKRTAMAKLSCKTDAELFKVASFFDVNEESRPAYFPKNDLCI